MLFARNCFDKTEKFTEKNGVKNRRSCRRREVFSKGREKPAGAQTAILAMFILCHVVSYTGTLSKA